MKLVKTVDACGLQCPGPILQLKQAVKGPDRLTLSKMNIAGMGLAMIKGIMRLKNVMSLPALIGQAKLSGVHLVVCTMSMDLMGIKSEELIDGIEEGDVAMYIDRLSRSSAGLFIS